MKKCLLILTILMVALASHAAVVSTFSAGVRLLRLFTVEVARPLDFGRILVNERGGSIQLDARNPRGAPITEGVIASGGHAVGEYRIAGGNANAVMNIVVSDARLSLEDGEDTLEVNLNLARESINLDATGSGMVAIGGTLVVPPEARMGTYRGEFNLTVDYQ